MKKSHLFGALAFFFALAVLNLSPWVIEKAKAATDDIIRYTAIPRD